MSGVSSTENGGLGRERLIILGGLMVTNFITGLVLGFVMPTLTVAVQNVVERKNLGVATTSVTFSRSLGSGIGVAVFGAILSNQLTDRIASSYAAGELHQSTVHILSNAGSNLSPAVLEKIAQAAGDVPVVKVVLANSLDVLFLSGAAIIGFGFLVALVLPNIDLGEEAHVDVEADGEAMADGGRPVDE